MEGKSRRAWCNICLKKVELVEYPGRKGIWLAKEHGCDPRHRAIELKKRSQRKARQTRAGVVDGGEEGRTPKTSVHQE